MAYAAATRTRPCHAHEGSRLWHAWLLHELTLDVIEQHMLKEDDGVVAADGAFEQRLAVGNCTAGHQLHARDGLEV